MAQLTAEQLVKLSTYLNDKQRLIQSMDPKATEVAIWVQEDLHFHVDVGQICHRIGPEGTILKHEWPGSEQSRKGRLGDRASQTIIVHQLELLRLDIARLGTALGEFGYGRIAENWRKVLAKAKCDLAETEHREPEER